MGRLVAAGALVVGSPGSKAVAASPAGTKLPPWINPMDAPFNAAGDGSTDDYAAFAAADAAAASTGAALIITRTHKIGASYTTKATIVMRTGRLKPARGVTLMIGQGFEAAPSAWCFDISAGGTVLFNNAITPTGYPEWFGAVGTAHGRPLGSNDNRGALDAAVAAFPEVRFAALNYTITDVWKMGSSSRTLQGTAGGGSTVGYGVDTANRMGMDGGTRIVLVGANVVSSTVFQFGKDAPSSSDDSGQMRNSSCRDLVFARDCSGAYKPRASLTSDPIDCVKGVLFIGASDCVMERCWSYDSPVGFHTIGVVISKLVDCSVRRVSPASTPAHDFFVGYLHGGYGAANFGYIGNSASTYFIRCHVFDRPPGIDTSWGMRLFGRFADVFVLDFEMARLAYGIEIDGRDKAGTAMSESGFKYAQQDVSIVNPTIDGCSSGGIWIHHTQAYFCVDIVNPYVASDGFNINGEHCGGSIKITAGRMLGNGLAFTHVEGLGIHGTHVRDATAPLVMTKCGMFDVQVDALQLDRACTQAVSLISVFRGRLALQLRGAPGKARYGVVCDAETNLVEVNGSGVNPGVFTSVDPANKVRYNGGDARTAFGTNVLSGVTS